MDQLDILKTKTLLKVHYIDRRNNFSKYKKRSLVSVLGGGDTLAAINKSKNKLSFSHLSTAGGAFLEFLEGKDLPGISVLK